MTTTSASSPITPPATTTTATTSLPAEPGLGRGTQLRRAVSAEWTRLWTVRSTWWSLTAALALLALLGTAFGLDMEGQAPVWVPGEIGMMFAQFPLAIPALLAVTSEYATGAIRSSLQAVPRRGVLATARATVGVGVAAAGAVVVATIAGVLAWVLLGAQAEVVAGDWVVSLLTVAAVVAAFTLVTAGVGATLRSSAGALTIAFLVQVVLPTLLPAFGVRWLEVLGEHLPGFATIALLDAFGEPPISATRAIVILAAWVVAAVAAGTWSLMRRDAA